MKHLKSAWNELCFRVSRAQIYLYKIFWPSRALKIKRLGERQLTIDQLSRSIEMNEIYQKHAGRKGKSFGNYTAKIELQKKFLADIQTSKIEDFEEISTKWIKKMKSLA